MKGADVYVIFLWCNKHTGGRNAWCNNLTLSWWDVIGWNSFALWILQIAQNVQETFTVFIFHVYFILVGMLSVLWRCWLSGRKGIRPVKSSRDTGVVICLERGADLHMAQLMPMPLASVKSRLVFTFLVPAHPGSPGKGKRAVKVCVCACVYFSGSKLLKYNKC